MPDTVLQQVKSLLAAPEPPGLGSGPRPGIRSEPDLEDSLAKIFAGSSLSPRTQELVRSLVLLWHDHLAASHVIAQAVENRDGSFIHGIMHRREPDYENAKYWFGRAGLHPC